MSLTHDHDGQSQFLHARLAQEREQLVPLFIRQGVHIHHPIYDLAQTKSFSKVMIDMEHKDKSVQRRRQNRKSISVALRVHTLIDPIFKQRQ